MAVMMVMSVMKVMAVMMVRSVMKVQCNLDYPALAYPEPRLSGIRND